MSRYRSSRRTFRHPGPHNDHSSLSYRGEHGGDGGLLIVGNIMGNSEDKENQDGALSTDLIGTVAKYGSEALRALVG